MEPIEFRTVVPTELGIEYWEQTAEGKLPLRRCECCGTKRLYLTEVCAECGSTEWTWTEASGKGTIYASTEIHYRLSPEFPEEYVLALVDLEEGVRMMANVLGAHYADVPIGTAVELDFETLGDGKRLPQFRLPAR